jgi:hypothetical protein
MTLHPPVKAPRLYPLQLSCAHLEHIGTAELGIAPQIRWSPRDHAPCERLCLRWLTTPVAVCGSSAQKGMSMGTTISTVVPVGFVTVSRTT